MMLGFLRMFFLPAKKRALPPSDGRLTKQSPLVPAETVAGRSLVIVIAIMTLLAGLTAGAATLIVEASSDWRADAATEATIQLLPTKGRDIETDLEKAAEIATKTPGVLRAKIYSQSESEGLLAPWLGQGLDLQELPIPRMIVLTLSQKERPDLAKLTMALISQFPEASLDDHHIFISRLGDMARAAAFMALVIFILVVVALGIAVASATRAAVATNREIVDVLHLVGAADDFIASQFRQRFLSLGLRGALIGGGGALAFFALARAMASYWRATAGGDQMEALFGSFALNAGGYFLILILIISVTLLTGFLSQQIVFRHLKQLT
ncbi:MAG: ABC transporter permease [Methylocystaceae bacterium]|nr:ABC transporter permease [Methylocystaceae bacterium]